MSTTEALHGEIISLLPLSVDDVTLRYVAWLNDPNVNRYLESRFNEHTIDSVRDFVQSQADNEFVHFWKILENGSSTHVGNIKLGPIEPYHLVADIGLMIGEDAYRGRGIGRQAVSLVTNYAMNTLHLAKVSAHAYEVNEASIRLFLSLGFQIEGRLRSHKICEGQRVSFVVMGKLNGE
jgi:RimJ/RimL family protein N-acetyltransferase